ncbi:MAG: hypothetical protein ABSD58_16465 [Verrucomicrobiia bacterium]|jgi:hypothetical protein
MKEPFFSIGIDVSKTSLDIDGLGKTFPARVTNDAQGIARLVSRLAETPPAVIVCEPSGGQGGLADSASEPHNRGARHASAQIDSV